MNESDKMMLWLDIVDFLLAQIFVKNNIEHNHLSKIINSLFRNLWIITWIKFVWIIFIYKNQFALQIQHESFQKNRNHYEFALKTQAQGGKAG